MESAIWFRVSSVRCSFGGLIVAPAADLLAELVDLVERAPGSERLVEERALGRGRRPIEDLVEALPVRRRERGCLDPRSDGLRLADHTAPRDLLREEPRFTL